MFIHVFIDASRPVEDIESFGYKIEILPVVKLVPGLRATWRLIARKQPFSNANVVISKLQIPKHKSYQTRCEHIIMDCFLPNKGGMEANA